MGQRTGISNRETADEEARERSEHPPLRREATPRRDTGGRKAGSRSQAQKESRSRYPDRTMPPARKKSGAFGKERRKSGVGRRPRG